MFHQPASADTGAGDEYDLELTEDQEVVAHRLCFFLELGVHLKKAQEWAVLRPHEVDTHYVQHLIRDLEYTVDQAIKLVDP